MVGEAIIANKTLNAGRLHGLALWRNRQCFTLCALSSSAPFRLLTLCLAVCLLLASPNARAGSYVLTYSLGQTKTVGIGPTPPGTTQTTSYSLNYDGSGSYGGGSGISWANRTASVTCSDGITATAAWQSINSSDMPPSCVIVKQFGTASWGGQGSGSAVPKGMCDDGLKDAEVDATMTPSPPGPPPSFTGVSSGTHWSSMSNPGASFALMPTPSASVSGTGTAGPPSVSGSGSASVSYTATLSPVTISLPGTTPDSNGNLHILIGQECSAVLGGIPSGCTASNIQWSVSGQTVQSNNWAISSGHTSATFSGYNAAYTYTQATSSAPPPSWYWDDQYSPETVSCTAIVTPPSGQGAAFSITVTQGLTLDVPEYTNSEPIGVVSLDAVWLGDYGSLSLHAGGSKTDMIPGIYFKDTVTTPTTPYSGTGTWYRVQLVTVSRYETSLTDSSVKGAPGNGVTGTLDVVLGGNDYKYNSQTINANGQTFDPNHNTTAENDSPGLPVSDAEQEYNVKQETFQDYIMYTPPTPSSGSSIAVPLFYYQWSWNADVKEPSTPSPRSWSYWNNAPTGGTIAPPSGTQRIFIYPTWSSFRSQQLP